MLVLNRLLLPLPLYQIADWVGQTVLVAVLGVPAAKFNDDRLGRTLDALSPHLDVIWREILETVLVTMEIDLSVPATWRMEPNVTSYSVPPVPNRMDTKVHPHYVPL